MVTIPNRYLDGNCQLLGLPGFSDSPALNLFPQLLHDDGLCVASDVMIYWRRVCPFGDDNEPIPGQTRIADVSVSFLPRRHISPLKDDHPIWQLQRNTYYDFQNSSGNCNSDWMLAHDFGLNPVTGYHPRNDWEHLADIGFVSVDAVERAVTEFSRIRECGWARDPAFDVGAYVKPINTEAPPDRNRSVSRRQRERSPAPLEFISFQEIWRMFND